MKSLVIISIVALTLGVACGAKKNATADVETPTPTNGTKVEKSDSLFVSLSRSFCFGKCPVYTVDIYNSGYAIYKGEANTEMIGTFTTKFTKDQLNSLTQVAKEINYLSLEDVYDSPVTDLPSHTSSIVINGVRKKVMRRHNYPHSILVFEQQIDTLVAQANWKAKLD